MHRPVREWRVQRGRVAAHKDGEAQHLHNHAAGVDGTRDNEGASSLACQFGRVGALPWAWISGWGESERGSKGGKRREETDGLAGKGTDC